MEVSKILYKEITEEGLDVEIQAANGKQYRILITEGILEDCGAVVEQELMTLNNWTGSPYQGIGTAPIGFDSLDYWDINYVCERLDDSYFELITE